MNGAEIDISLADGTGRRTHSMVRPRHVAGGTRYAAVYPGPPAGHVYGLAARRTPALTVTVTEGTAAVATLDY